MCLKWLVRNVTKHGLSPRTFNSNKGCFMILLKKALSKTRQTYRKHPVMLTILGLYLLAAVLTGTVIGQVTDAETGKPIEGAVVAASWEWVLPVPPEGDDVNALGESVTHKNGWFVIFRPTLLIFSYPMVTVYDGEHAMWSNKGHFDGWKFYWTENGNRPPRFWMPVSLIPWVDGMSHCEQENFFDSIFTVGGGSTKLMFKADLSERQRCEHERKEKRKVLGEKP